MMMMDPASMTASMNAFQQQHQHGLTMSAIAAFMAQHNLSEPAQGGKFGKSSSGSDHKGKGVRHLKSPHQMRQLKLYFATNKRPDKEECRKLVKQTELPYKEVQRWFRNERHKDKKAAETKQEARHETLRELAQGGDGSAEAKKSKRVKSEDAMDDGEEGEDGEEDDDSHSSQPLSQLPQSVMEMMFQQQQQQQQQQALAPTQTPAQIAAQAMFFEKVIIPQLGPEGLGLFVNMAQERQRAISMQSSPSPARHSAASVIAAAQAASGNGQYYGGDQQQQQYQPPPPPQPFFAPNSLVQQAMCQFSQQPADHHNNVKDDVPALPV
jgi:hypothetical protein